MSADSGEKTEQPTAKKRSDARKKGNLPKSRDLSAAAGLIAAILLLRLIGPFMARTMDTFVNKILERDFPTLLMPYRKEIIPYALDWMIWLALLILPFLALLFVATYAVNLLQVGFLFTVEPLKLDFKKLNPVSGLKRIFALRNLMLLVMNLAKLVVIMSVAWSTIISELGNVIVMVEMETAGAFIYATNSILNLALKLAVILLVLGIIDFWYQKHVHTKKLKMTKQEVKEEFKQMEGDPKVKQKRRQLQMQQAMQRMMKEVPQAEVVVRNPTHFAVAISYKPGMAAPVVVAKGKDKMAEKIIGEAKKAGVPLVENPPLARELHRRVEIGDMIPEELFATVAEILTSVMDAEKKRRMMQSLNAGAA